LEHLGTASFLLKDISTAMNSFKTAYNISKNDEKIANNYGVTLLFFE